MLTRVIRVHVTARGSLHELTTWLSITENFSVIDSRNSETKVNSRDEKQIVSYLRPLTAKVEILQETVADSWSWKKIYKAPVCII